MKSIGMIKANELRLGNWVIFNDDTDRYGKVLEILKTYPRLSCNYIPDHNENKVTGCSVDYDFIEPIPLSPDILLSAGFDVEEKESRRNDIPDNKYQVYTKGAFTYNSIHGWWFNGKQLDNQPEYLHQLQNLYFVLTGQELEIDLTEG